MRVAAVGSINQSELAGADFGPPGARSGGQGSADRVVLSAPAHRAQGDTASPSETLPFSVHGAQGAVVLGPGHGPGLVHVSIRIGSDANGEGVAMSLEADVRQSWLGTVTAGAANGEERADRIARAVAGLATIPGQGVVGFAENAAPAIRGPVRPRWPQVWLPAEYPPPPDDPALLAALRPGAGH